MRTILAVNQCSQEGGMLFCGTLICILKYVAKILVLLRSEYHFISALPINTDQLLCFHGKVDIEKLSFVKVLLQTFNYSSY